MSISKVSLVPGRAKTKYSLLRSLADLLTRDLGRTACYLVGVDTYE